MSEHLLSIICGVLIALLPSTRAAAAETIPLASSDEIRRALNACDKSIVRVDSIPYYVMLSLARLTGDPEFTLANPNEDYVSSDVVLDGRLPRRQLAFAGMAQDYLFLCYNRGGMAAAFCIFVFDLDRRFYKAHPMMVAQVSFNPSHFEPPPKNLAELIKQFDAGRLIQYQPTFNEF